MIVKSNQEWLAALRSQDNEQALEELRHSLERGLHYALAGRMDDSQLEALQEDIAQDAVVKVLANLDTFRGESQFLTWATKIAVRLAFSELRRKRWRDVSIEALQKEDEGQEYTPAFLADSSPSPEKQASLNGMMNMVQQMMEETLSERQRTALQTVMAGQMPLEEIARRMGTSRNTLYKLLHDARLRMQKRLVEAGLSPQDLLAIFDEK
jgi:RNA polymerase sigma-70 factor (ECF subfamily)